MKKKRKVFVSIICILLAVLMALSLVLMVIPANAVSEAEIEELQRKREALEQQLAEQTAYIEELTANRSLIIDRKAALDKRITMNREEIELISQEVSAYDLLLTEKETELEEAKLREAEQSERLRARMRTMEEQGEYSYFSFIFSAHGLSDLLSRIRDIKDIMNYDRALEQEYRETREEIERLTAEYEETLSEQEALRKEMNKKLEELDAQTKAACDLIANLDTLSENAEAEYAAIAAAEAQAWEEQQRMAVQLAAQYAAFFAQSTTTGGTTSGGTAATGTGTAGGDVSALYTGGFIWPTQSTYVTSKFGYRDAPTAGASSYHQAIDIGASYGTPIYAAASGYVSASTYNDGLGTYVSIEHGGDTSTRYSHMSQSVVSPGQYVEQGQIIGYVGDSGIATGAHLDFSVTQGGEKVDPLQYYDTSGLSYSPTA